MEKPTQPLQGYKDGRDRGFAGSVIKGSLMLLACSSAWTEGGPSLLFLCAFSEASCPKGRKIRISSGGHLSTAFLSFFILFTLDSSKNV